MTFTQYEAYEHLADGTRYEETGLSSDEITAEEYQELVEAVYHLHLTDLVVESTPDESVEVYKAGKKVFTHKYSLEWYYDDDSLPGSVSDCGGVDG